jgi:hypothetical protein
MRVQTASELPAPDVAFEACAEFEADTAEPGLCSACGWLEDEHAAFEIPTAA